MMHYVSQHLYRKKITELDEIYISMSLRSFAISLVAIFIPIYLYKLGYSLQNILFFHMLIYIYKGIGEYFSGKLVSKFGAKHIIAFSLPLMALSFVFLLTLEIYHWPLWFLAFTNALPLSLFWLSYHDDLSKAKHQKTVGSEIGKVQVLVTVASALGPLLGGLIAESLGMPFSLGLATGLMLLAVMPLFRTPEITSRRPLKRSNFSIRNNVGDMVAYGGLGLENISSMVIWPLFLFLVVSSYQKVGIITTIALFFAIAGSFFIGRMTDKYDKGRVLKVSSLTHSASVAARSLATSANAAYVVSIISSITHIMMFVPFVSEYYIRADEHPRTEYILGMEIAVDIARALGFAFLIVATLFLSLKEVLFVGILLGVVGAILTMFIGKSGNEKTFVVARARGKT